MTRIGSVCTGFGGLDLAVHAVLGGELAWTADNDAAAARIIAHRFPGVLNHGDITAVDWDEVEPVSILTAGFPCQDVSCAGGRKGLRAGTRSGVWTHVAEAIGQLRPSLIFLENVRGLLSAGADSNLECCPWCLGETGDELALRASGAVYGDLADLGFDAEGIVVSAAEAGAPHRRERVFILAWPAADPGSGEFQRRGIPGVLGGPQAGEPGEGHQRQRAGDAARHGGAAAEDADGATRGERRLAAPGQAEGRGPRADAGRPGGAPAPADAERDPRTQDEPHRPAAARHRHAPADADGAREGWGELPARRCEPGRRPAGGREVPPDAPGDGRHQGRPGPAGVAGRPDASLGCDGAAADAVGGGRDGRPQDPQREPERGAAARRDSPALADWGPYGPAIALWERVTGRPAPRPTEPGRTGERLSPRFVEFLMGLPEGWVTGIPGLSRNAQLKALGNGCVPAQAELALRILLDRGGFTATGEAA